MKTKEPVPRGLSWCWWNHCWGMLVGSLLVGYWWATGGLLVVVVVFLVEMLWAWRRRGSCCPGLPPRPGVRSSLLQQH